MQEQDQLLGGLILAAYYSLRDAAGKFLEERLAQAYGPDWLIKHNGNRAKLYRPAAPISRDRTMTILWEPYAALKSLEIEFESVIRPYFEKQDVNWKRVRGIITQLLKLRNSLIAHPREDFLDSEAILFIKHCRDLSEVFGKTENVNQITQLLEKAEGETSSGGPMSSWDDEVYVSVYIKLKPGVAVAQTMFDDLEFAGKVLWHHESWIRFDEVCQVDYETFRVDLRIIPEEWTYSISKEIKEFFEDLPFVDYALVSPM